VTLEVKQAHELGLDEAKRRLATLADELKADGFTWRWQDDGARIAFEGRGATGTATPTASDVLVMVDLPFLLRGFSGTVEKKIAERLARALAPAVGAPAGFAGAEHGAPAERPATRQPGALATLPDLPGLAATSAQFRAGIIAIGRATGYPADEIAGVMAIESGFAPSATNITGGKGGTGATV